MSISLPGCHGLPAALTRLISRAPFFAQQFLSRHSNLNISSVLRLSRTRVEVFMNHLSHAHLSRLAFTVILERELLMKRLITGALFLLCLITMAPVQAFADGGVCPRPPAGSVVAPPPRSLQQRGVLNVSFNFYTSVDDLGPHPVLLRDFGWDGVSHVACESGDTVNIHLTNMVQGAPLGPERNRFQYKDRLRRFHDDADLGQYALSWIERVA
ncbi:MAG: hypothetical protein WDM89_10665 [Rhizomicrobium sp.]